MCVLRTFRVGDYMTVAEHCKTSTQVEGEVEEPAQNRGCGVRDYVLVGENILWKELKGRARNTPAIIPG
jgi:hypothetical protein